MSGSAAPAVSVIMATYNGALTIRKSIDSILSQTWRDFELIVADDGSSDDTLAILDDVGDPRLRILRNPGNIGVVASRNRLFEQARAPYVAMLDHDDLSAPTRLARQVGYLGANPGTVLVGTASRVLDGGVLRRMSHPDATTPGLIAWLLHVANPLVCSSVMFRADAVRRLGAFMRASYVYADDYEFYHRMATLGQVARLDVTLTTYRLHDSNAFKRHEEIMTQNAVRVLEPPYRAWFGEQARDAASLVVRHLSAGRPVENPAALARLARVFGTVNEAFLSAPSIEPDTARAIERQAGVLWQRVLDATNRSGKLRLSDLVSIRPAGLRPAAGKLWRMALDHLPFRGRTRDVLRYMAPAPRSAPPLPGKLYDATYVPVPSEPASTPTLFVVVDTEAEFDWRKPFSRELTEVSAMDDIERGQAVFDTYGLRPIYVIDYPVATQTRGSARLREILERDGCEIGAHLHPWTTPPFDETVCARNSYPGNLEPWLEERKLATLMAAIRDSFGLSPVFYKAGRYGFGPATPAALMRHGIRVDLSVLPGADLRRRCGPDFRGLAAVPYRIEGTSILSVPMTRSDIGAAPSLQAVGQAVQDLPGGRLLRLPSVLARLGLAETITLTPEGVTAREQIRLLQAMMKRGSRQFVLHYHSPSLRPGNTPYVRDAAGAEVLLGRLAEVCSFFFDDLGGLPGYPRDLLRVLDFAV